MSPPGSPPSDERVDTSQMRSWLEAVGARARSSPRYQWWVLWVTLSGLLATNLLFTVLVVALPEISRGLHTTQSTATWVVTGPLLAFGVVAPLVGKAGDLWGHRRLFMIGITAETIVAVLSAVAPSIGVLIAARILGGMVGASIGSASMALVLSVFGKHDRVKALGFWSLVGAGGPVIGVAVGGPVIQLLGWRWMFFLQVPLLVMAALLALAVLPERAAGRGHFRRGDVQFDWAGAGSITVCSASLLLALNRGPVWGWSSPGVLICFAVSVVAGVAFRAAERGAAQPIFPLPYLHKRNFIFPIAAQTFANFAYLGAFFMAPLLLEGVFGYAHNQSAVGFLVLPRPIVFSAIAPLAGYVAVRIGERTSAVVGTSAVALSMAAFALAGHSTGLALVEIAFVLSGVGLGVASPSLSAMVANEFASEDLGTAAASQQLMNQVGTVAGIQVMQTLQTAAARGHTGPGALLNSFHLAYWVGGGVALLGVAAAVRSRSTDRGGVASVEAMEALDVTERQPVTLAPPDSDSDSDTDSDTDSDPDPPPVPLRELPIETGLRFRPTGPAPG